MKRILLSLALIAGCFSAYAQEVFSVTYSEEGESVTKTAPFDDNGIAIVQATPSNPNISYGFTVDGVAMYPESDLSLTTRVGLTDSQTGIDGLIHHWYMEYTESWYEGSLWFKYNRNENLLSIYQFNPAEPIIPHQEVYYYPADNWDYNSLSYFSNLGNGIFETTFLYNPSLAILADNWEVTPLETVENGKDVPFTLIKNISSGPYVTNIDNAPYGGKLTLDFNTMTLNFHAQTERDCISCFLIPCDSEVGGMAFINKISFQKNKSDNSKRTIDIDYLPAGEYLFCTSSPIPYGTCYNFMTSDYPYLEIDSEISLNSLEETISVYLDEVEDVYDIPTYKAILQCDGLKFVNLSFDVETNTLSIGRPDRYFTAVNTDGVEFEYSVIENTEKPSLKVIGTIGAEGDIVVPAKVRHGGTVYEVTELGEKAFSEEGITSVKLPDSITNIGQAFRECKLSTVYLGKGITEIPDYAFYHTPLTAIEIPETVTSIGAYAFADCRLTEITIPENVTSLGHHIFWEDSPYKVVIEGNITDLPEYFMYRKDLAEGYQSLVLPSSIKRIQPNSMDGNVDIYFPDMETLLYLNIDGEPMFYFFAYVNGKKVNKLVIPDDFTSFPNFLKKMDITSLNTGNGIKIVPETNPNITSITLGTSVTRVTGNYLFVNTVITHAEKAPAISETTFPRVSFDNDNPGIVILDNEKMYTTYSKANVWKNLNLTHSGYVAEVTLDEAGDLSNQIYEQCDMPAPKVVGLTVHGNMNAADFSQILSNIPGLLTLDIADVTLPDNRIPANALKGKSNLTSIVLPTSATEIGEDAFSGCISLESLSLPASLKTIGARAFYGCTGITSLDLPSSLEEVGNEAFFGTGITSLETNASLRTIGYSAFSSTPLKSIILNEGLESIGGNAFTSTAIKGRLDLPHTLKSIGSAAFANTRISGYLAIYDNTTYVGDGAFAHTDIDGTVISNKINTIPARLYESCRYLDRVVLLDNVTSVGESAFKGCSSLYDLRISEGLQSIDSYGLAYTAVPSVYLPEGFTTLGYSALEGCSGLRTLSLPSTTKSLGESALQGCRNLRNLSVSALTPPSVTASTFKGINTDLCILSIPTTAKRDYRNANIWGRFTNMRNDIAVEVEGEGEITFDFVDNIDDEMAEDIPANGPTRAAMRRIESESNVASGSTLYIPSDGKVCFFITPTENDDEYTVFYNDEDVTEQVVNGMYIPENYKRDGMLKVSFNSGSGIQNVAADAIVTGEAVYYDLQDRRVDNPVSGLYIVVRGTKVTKEVIK